MRTGRLFMVMAVKEEIPPNAPKPRGKYVVLRLIVDSDHAGDPVR